MILVVSESILSEKPIGEERRARTYCDARWNSDMTETRLRPCQHHGTGTRYVLKKAQPGFA